MIIIAQTSSGARFIGEVGGETAPEPGSPFTLRFPLAYIEQANGKGQMAVAMPPAILAAPVEEVRVVADVVFPVTSSAFLQVRQAYEQASQAARAAASNLVVAPAAALRSIPGPDAK